MNFFGKKDKGVNFNNNPQENSTLPELPEENYSETSLPELPPLPEIPSTTANDSFSLGAIKSSILGEKNNSLKMPKLNERRAIELPELPEETSSLLRTTPSRKTEIKTIRPEMHPIKEQIFVKLDKFKLAFEKFEEIKKKAAEIENHLIKSREFQEREEQELRAWEEELRIIKEKITEIDSAIFSKV